MLHKKPNNTHLSKGFLSSNVWSNPNDNLYLSGLMYIANILVSINANFIDQFLHVEKRKSFTLNKQYLTGQMDSISFSVLTSSRMDVLAFSYNLFHFNFDQDQVIYNINKVHRNRG